MRDHFVRLVIVVVSLALCAPAAFAQAAPQGAPKASNWGGQAEGPFPKLPPLDPNAPFDKRDFSGVWLTDHSSTNGYRGMTDEPDIPPKTPWAEEVFRSRLTGRTSKAKEGVMPAFGNDPIMGCNPKGFPRLLFYTDPAEFIHTPTRILMMFQSQGATRQIWMDGRPLPTNPDPRWMGFSVGRWEGDTLVIDTVGFDDRAWLDQYGNAYSYDMRFQERWRRTGRDTLEVVYRLEDPKSYTRPWVSTTKVWERQAPEIREELCAPMDELQFNEAIRDPAGGVIHK
jgi:hypothetical protein